MTTKSLLLLINTHIYNCDWDGHRGLAILHDHKAGDMLKILTRFCQSPFNQTQVLQGTFHCLIADVHGSYRVNRKFNQFEFKWYSKDLCNKNCNNYKNSILSTLVCFKMGFCSFTSFRL